MWVCVGTATGIAAQPVSPTHACECLSPSLSETWARSKTATWTQTAVDNDTCGHPVRHLPAQQYLQDESACIHHHGALHLHPFLSAKRHKTTIPYICTHSLHVRHKTPMWCPWPCARVCVDTRGTGGKVNMCGVRVAAGHTKHTSTQDIPTSCAARVWLAMALDPAGLTAANTATHSKPIRSCGPEIRTRQICLSSSGYAGSKLHMRARAGASHGKSHPLQMVPPYCRWQLDGQVV